MRRPVVIDFLLRLINFVFNIFGLTIIGYALIRLMKMRVSGSKKSQHSDNWSDKILSTWFIYLLITIGTAFFVTSVCGCIGASTRSPSFLTLYCAFLFGVMVTELGVAAFIFFDHTWHEDIIITDKSGSLDTIYHFLKTHWTFIKWILVGALAFEAIALIMSLYLRYLCKEEDEDEERKTVHPRGRGHVHGHDRPSRKQPEVAPWSTPAGSVPGDAFPRTRTREPTPRSEKQAVPRPGGAAGYTTIAPGAAQPKPAYTRAREHTAARSGQFMARAQAGSLPKQQGAAMKQPMLPPPPGKVNLASAPRQYND